MNATFSNDHFLLFFYNKGMNFYNKGAIFTRFLFYKRRAFFYSKGAMFLQDDIFYKTFFLQDDVFYKTIFTTKVRYLIVTNRPLIV